MDIDLEGKTSNELESVASLIRTICEETVEPDGIEFDSASVEVSRINEDADYSGIRASFHGTLARARIPMQIDIGFGDIITPEPTKLIYPTLLDFPAPVLQAYPRETVVAEKLEALTTLGLLNSRMKDFYDLALLSRMYPFDGEHLVRAIIATFRHRGTQIESEPVGLTPAWYGDPAREVQWRAFVRRSRLDDESKGLDQLVDRVRRFVLDPLVAAAAGRALEAHWPTGGPWDHRRSNP
jgi:hypothetical protein